MIVSTRPPESAERQRPSFQFTLCRHGLRRSPNADELAAGEPERIAASFVEVPVGEPNAYVPFIASSEANRAQQSAEGIREGVMRARKGADMGAPNIPILTFSELSERNSETVTDSLRAMYSFILKIAARLEGSHLPQGKVMNVPVVSHQPYIKRFLKHVFGESFFEMHFKKEIEENERAQLSIIPNEDPEKLCIIVSFRGNTASVLAHVPTLEIRDRKLSR